jgi:cysteine desulfuration protein SufE
MNRAQELIEQFQLFDEWEERYAYVIELGKKLPPMDSALKQEATRVHGCTAQVWMFATPSPEGNVHFEGDSDAAIVRGLIALLFAAYQNQKPDDILQFDAKAYFAALGLASHLSPSRSNGFFAMVERIRHEAGKAA